MEITIKNTLLETGNNLLLIVFCKKHQVYIVNKVEDKSILLITEDPGDPKIEIKQDEFKGWYYESKETSIGGPSDIVSHIYPLIAKVIY